MSAMTPACPTFPSYCPRVGPKAHSAHAPQAQGARSPRHRPHPPIHPQANRRLPMGQPHPVPRRSHPPTDSKKASGSRSSLWRPPTPSEPPPALTIPPHPLRLRSQAHQPTQPQAPASQPHFACTQHHRQSHQPTPRHCPNCPPNLPYSPPAPYQRPYFVSIPSGHEPGPPNTSAPTDPCQPTAEPWRIQPCQNSPLRSRTKSGNGAIVT